ncbi:hypothetical protein AB836_02145 [Rickettsiales bacterium (ex Bugula neritina AB1)]|nr:hypothetical protein AB836_02145 [Rickettsiales bacterium (ex Bugula neritina AB1)]
MIDKVNNNLEEIENIDTSQDNIEQNEFILEGDDFTKKYDNYYTFFLQYKTQNTPLKGFRPNKTPINLIAITYNKELSEQTIQYMVEECFQEIKKTYDNIKDIKVKVEENKLIINFLGKNKTNLNNNTVDLEKQLDKE